MMKRVVSLAFGAGLMAVAGAAFAGTVTVTVPGTANPFLTGVAPGGSVTIGGFTDTAPAESPVFAETVSGGETVTFSDITGSTSHGSCCAAFGAAGNPADPLSSSGGTTVGGYTNFPGSALVGVFYDPSAAQGTGTSSTTTLTPAVNQVFYIGDGSLGGVVVPTGATSLYLGTVDGVQWNNNTGDLSVTLTSVPEPATWAMLLLGVSGLGAGLRLRRRHGGLAAA